MEDKKLQNAGTKSAQLTKIMAEMVTLVDEANANLKDGKVTEYGLTVQRLTAREKEYNSLYLSTIYDNLKTKENPMLEAIKLRKYNAVAHVENKDSETHIVMNIELITDREKPLDLLRFCRYAKSKDNNITTTWQHNVARFNQLLCFRAAEDLNLSAEDMAVIKANYALSDIAREIEVGKTPTSNTQLCKTLQSIIDKIIFVDDGTGNNKYKCNNHDVAYIRECYTSRSTKADLTVQVSKDNKVISLITDVCYCIVNGLKYGVNGYRTSDNKIPAAPPKPAKKAKAPKAPKAKKGKKTETAATPAPETATVVAA